MLELYKKHGEAVGVQWNVLAAVGKRETDHGRSKLPGVQSGTNYAGAAGPMQFLISTWGGKAQIKIPSEFNGYASDGDDDGVADVYNPADAILGAAKMLKRNGAPDDLRRALFVYNRANWYVDQVLEIAARYAESGEVEVPPEANPACEVAYDAPNAVVDKILDYALAQRGKPYIWGGTELGRLRLLGDHLHGVPERGSEHPPHHLRPVAVRGAHRHAARSRPGIWCSSTPAPGPRPTTPATWAWWSPPARWSRPAAPSAAPSR